MLQSCDFVVARLFVTRMQHLCNASVMCRCDLCSANPGENQSPGNVVKNYERSKSKKNPDVLRHLPPCGGPGVYSPRALFYKMTLIDGEVYEKSTMCGARRLVGCFSISASSRRPRPDGIICGLSLQTAGSNLHDSRQ